MEWFQKRTRLTSGKSPGLVVLLVGLLVCIFSGMLFSTPVFADDATWDSDGNISANGTTHRPVTSKQTVKDMGFDDGTLVFATSYSVDSSSSAQTISVISFPPGTDPQDANSGTMSQFSFTPPSTWSRSSQEQIAVDNESYQDASSAGSCQIDQIGWMVCGPSLWIAKGVDTIYEWLEDFLTVRELEINNRTSSMHQAWNVMRGIANTAFIIAFLIIIYSQVASIGVSNYGIKRLAPRLILAALFVNISFFICAAAIDISNIFGHALKQFFDDLNSSLMSSSSANNEGIGSTESIVQAVLSGGTLLIGGGLAVAGSTTAAAPLVIPLLLTVFIALLVALVVFAVRQALIVILVIISPLAFVCYLLPGTEKWFEKWRSTFLTMLVFFPAFAVVFGGAQLAGMLITSNASTIVMAIIGWAVQLAPLALAPLVMKLGGGVLNRVAGIVNDPTKGIVDKSKQWAHNKSRAMSTGSYDSMMRRRQQWKDGGERGGFVGRAWYGAHGSARRAARYMSNKSRLVKDQADNAEKMEENYYHNSDAYKRHDLKSRQTNDQAELLSQQASNRYDEMRAGHAPVDLNIRLRDKLDNRLRTNTTYDRLISREIDDITTDAQTTFENIAVQGFRKTNNQRHLNQMFAERIAANESLQKAASGVYGDAADGYQKGMDAALASAITAMRNDYGKSVEEGAQIVKHFNLSSSDRQTHALGGTVRVQDGAGNWRIFDSSNTFTREAVIEEQIAVGTVAQVKEIVQQSGSTLAEFKTTISAAVAKSGVKGKAPFIGGKLIDDIAKGAITSEDALIGYIQDWIADGKFRDEDVAITDPDGLKLLMQAARSDTGHMTPKLKAQMKYGLTELSEKAKNSLEVDDLKQRVSTKAQPLMKKISRGDFSE